MNANKIQYEFDMFSRFKNISRKANLLICYGHPLSNVPDRLKFKK